jgi:hypothetical protein
MELSVIGQWHVVGLSRLYILYQKLDRTSRALQPLLLAKIFFVLIL